ncbi:MAG: type II secretion system F family protein [Pseudomonadota bacterium]
MLIETGILASGAAFLLFWRRWVSVHRERMKRLETERLTSVRRWLWKEFVFVELRHLRTAARGAMGLSAALSLLWVSPWPLLVGVGAIWILPELGARQFARARRKRFDRQLGTALPKIVSVLQAGHTFERALESLSLTEPNPLAQELGLVLKERRLGVALETSLQHLLERFPGRDLEMVVRAVSVSQKSGSSLSDAFNSVADLILKRRALMDRLSSVTAQGRAQAWIAITMPILLLAALRFVDPSYIEPLFSTGSGRAVLILCSLLLSAGGFWIHKIAHMELIR